MPHTRNIKVFHVMTKFTSSKPWGSRTRAGDAQIAPYNLFASLCFFSKLTNFWQLENAFAPPNPPCKTNKKKWIKTTRNHNSKLAQQNNNDDQEYKWLTGRRMRSYWSSAASSKSISATIFTCLDATISTVSSIEATTTLAPALRRISIIMIASISSDPFAIGTRICYENA